MEPPCLAEVGGMAELGAPRLAEVEVLSMADLGATRLAELGFGFLTMAELGVPRLAELGVPHLAELGVSMAELGCPPILQGRPPMVPPGMDPILAELGVILILGVGVRLILVELGVGVRLILGGGSLCTQAVMARYVMSPLFSVSNLILADTKRL